MLKKALGIFLLTALGSLAGIAVYTTFFEQQKVYVQRDYFQPVFSSYDTDHPQPPSNGQPDFVPAVENARSAVVHIRARYESRTNRRHSDFFSNPFREYFEDDGYEPPQGMASGSGVLISPDGYVATNNHVIEDAKEVEVTLFDNRSFIAEVIGTDISTDLALIKIDEQDLPYLRFGNSDQVKVGEWVLAVGNPMDLNSTVTAGIVSAKGRNLNLLRPDSEFAIESFIQTDAAVNKGNSGGALVNTAGELIGINTAIASRTGYYAGYSFAIPTTIVQKVMEDLLSFGEVRRGFLGVSIQPVNANIARRYKLEVLKGAYVTQINEKLGAAQAGIRTGDVIISVNEVPVNNSSELQEQVSRYRPGDTVNLKVFRGKREMNVKVVLKTLEGEGSYAQMRTTMLEYRGSMFRLLSEEELEEYGRDHGILVEHLGEELSEKGLDEGFLITKINGQKVDSIEALQRILDQAGEYMRITGYYKGDTTPTTYSFSW